MRLDDQLHRRLMTAWRAAFVRQQFGWRARRLFRSLEIAFQAAGLPDENLGTAHDYGTHLALWVSAFEVLVRPYRGRSELRGVLDFLGRARFYRPSLSRRRYSARIGGQRLALNFAQRLYVQIYNARNAFLHGNP